MKPDFDSPEWQEAIRLLHQLVPHSNFISCPQDLSLEAGRSIIQAYDPDSERRHFTLQATEGSGEGFLRIVGDEHLTGQRALVIPDLGCGWAEYYPFVCNDRSLQERLNEELRSETLLNSKDTLIVLESGVLALFDHEDGVTVGTSRIEEEAEQAVHGNTH